MTKTNAAGSEMDMPDYKFGQLERYFPPLFNGKFSSFVVKAQQSKLDTDLASHHMLCLNCYKVPILLWISKGECFFFSFWELTFSLSILCFVSVVAKEMRHVSDLF
jgi:hypothetical protein